METYLEHLERVREASKEGRDPPPSPSAESIGHAPEIMKYAKFGEQYFKGTEKEAMEIRKKLYATNSCFGNAQVWMTLTPDDLSDPIAAAYAGFVPRVATVDMDDEQRRLLDLENKADMAAAIAANPVACAIAFREQLRIFVENVIGWDLQKNRAHMRGRAMLQVLAFNLQVSPPPERYDTIVPFCMYHIVALLFEALLANNIISIRS